MDPTACFVSAVKHGSAMSAIALWPSSPQENAARDVASRQQRLTVKMAMLVFGMVELRTVSQVG
jgi:hypothetical protein